MAQVDGGAAVAAPDPADGSEDSLVARLREWASEGDDASPSGETPESPPPPPESNQGAEGDAAGDPPPAAEAAPTPPEGDAGDETPPETADDFYARYEVTRETAAWLAEHPDQAEGLEARTDAPAAAAEPPADTRTPEERIAELERQTAEAPQRYAEAQQRKAELDEMRAMKESLDVDDPKDSMLLRLIEDREATAQEGPTEPRTPATEPAEWDQDTREMVALIRDQTIEPLRQMPWAQGLSPEAFTQRLADRMTELNLPTSISQMGYAMARVNAAEMSAHGERVSRSSRNERVIQDRQTARGTDPVNVNQGDHQASFASLRRRLADPADDFGNSITDMNRFADHPDNPDSPANQEYI